MTKWGMVFDLKKCITCYACMIACKQKYFIPSEVYRNRLVVGDMGKEFPLSKQRAYPVLCNHCTNAVCVDVCPTGATFKREDGLVGIDSDKCIGCHYCVLACPYQQRTFLESTEKEYFPGQGLTEYERMGRILNPLKAGAIIKCDFCLERIDDGLRKGQKPGLDRDATPVCVNTCPVKARYFGDLDDPDSNVSILIREKKGFPLHPEWDTEPSVFYIDY